MQILDFLKNVFLKPKTEKKELLSEEDALNISFKVVVVEFAENVESSAGEIFAALLRSFGYFNVSYFNCFFNIPQILQIIIFSKFKIK
mgnify:CR=1 FL=1